VSDGYGDGHGDADGYGRSYASSPGVYGIQYGGYGGGSSSWSGYGYNEQDRERRFLASNGGCAYIDLSHLELCVPEVTNARDFVAAYHAMLRIGQGAMTRAQAGLDPGEVLEVLVNNSDGLSNSYGSHLNFLVTRQLWDDLMGRRPHYLAFLASHQVSSIVYTGQGKVGSENGRAPVGYQLAQRADFFETLCAQQTTYQRPIINSRNESLCGKRDDDYARLHHIFTDAGLAQVATYLKVGTMQLVLAMLEAGDVDLSLPLQIQRGLLEAALRHDDRTGFPTVPGAEDILLCWQDTLDRLDTGELAAVSDRLDWAAKLEWIELARAESAEAGTELEWGSDELKHLDLLYSSLDPARGLYWLYERAGAFHSVVEDAEIERFTHEPPDDTRAWTRAMLLRQFGPAGEVDRVDWDRVVVEATADDGASRRLEISLDDPLGNTRADNEALFARGTQASAANDSNNGDDNPISRSTT